MPLNLKLRRLTLRKSKAALPDLKKDGDAVSIDSLSILASNDSLWTAQGACSNIFIIQS